MTHLLLVLCALMTMAGSLDPDGFEGSPLNSVQGQESDLPDRGLNPTLPDPAQGADFASNEKKGIETWQLIVGLLFFGGIMIWAGLRRRVGRGH